MINEFDEKQSLAMIKTIIAEETDMNPDDITEEMTLSNDLEMDENSIMQVLCACEAEFDVHYEEQDREDIKTVGDILNSLSEWS